MIRGGREEMAQFQIMSWISLGSFGKRVKVVVVVTVS